MRASGIVNISAVVSLEYTNFSPSTGDAGRPGRRSCSRFGRHRDLREARLDGKGRCWSSCHQLRAKPVSPCTCCWARSGRSRCRRMRRDLGDADNADVRSCRRRGHDGLAVGIRRQQRCASPCPPYSTSAMPSRQISTRSPTAAAAIRLEMPISASVAAAPWVTVASAENGRCDGRRWPRPRRMPDQAVICMGYSPVEIGRDGIDRLGEAEVVAGLLHPLVVCPVPDPRPVCRFAAVAPRRSPGHARHS